MSKIIPYISAAVILTLTGCSGAVLPEESVPLTFTASIDEYAGTKAAGDGSLADWCVMELFYEGTSVQRDTASLNSGSFTFSLRVVANRTYDIAFWAGHKGVYGVSSLKAVTVPTDAAGDSTDAFCACVREVMAASDQPVLNVILKRPFGMVNITPDPSSVSFVAPTVYNVLEDTMGSPGTFNACSGSYFVLAPAGQTLMDFTINGQVCTTVPVRRNYKTNITINN